MLDRRVECNKCVRSGLRKLDGAGKPEEPIHYCLKVFPRETGKISKSAMRLNRIQDYWDAFIGYLVVLLLCGIAAMIFCGGEI